MNASNPNFLVSLAPCQQYREAMTARLKDIADLPDWPRGLSVEQAAAYCGVSVPTFLWEVEQGKWPPGERRGAKGARVIWDKRLLDEFYDRCSLTSAETALTEEEALARLQ